jgi:hypothetical protein
MDNAEQRLQRFMERFLASQADAIINQAVELYIQAGKQALSKPSTSQRSR